MPRSTRASALRRAAHEPFPASARHVGRHGRICNPGHPASVRAACPHHLARRSAEDRRAGAACSLLRPGLSTWHGSPRTRRARRPALRRADLACRRPRGSLFGHGPRRLRRHGGRVFRRVRRRGVDARGRRLPDRAGLPACACLRQHDRGVDPDRRACHRAWRMGRSGPADASPGAGDPRAGLCRLGKGDRHASRGDRLPRDPAECVAAGTGALRDHRRRRDPHRGGPFLSRPRQSEYRHLGLDDRRGPRRAALGRLSLRHTGRRTCRDRTRRSSLQRRSRQSAWR
ncbi:hypothetical protein RHECNPAF_930025 [Rhizobium etli CNPAF512]|nr:hypothetical protein RHECNPAF_930025 [Rhizobium etli CNPAF512]